MSFFDTFSFVDDPQFILAVIAAGVFLRFGACLADWIIGSFSWLLRFLRKKS